MVFIDAIHVKVRDGQVANRPIYVALAVTVDGNRDILGLWAGDGGEGAKYWQQVLTEIKNRGVADVLMLVCDGLKGLPFDHQAIVDAALARVRNKSSYSSLPVHLCGESFTLPALQKIYETLLGEAINKVSFRRKIDELNILEPILGALESGKANRPAQLYRLKTSFRQQLSLTDRALNRHKTERSMLGIE